MVAFLISAGSLLQSDEAAITKERALSVGSIFCCGYCRSVLLLERRLQEDLALTVISSVT